jgi:hypothetical protein
MVKQVFKATLFLSPLGVFAGVVSACDYYYPPIRLQICCLVGGLAHGGCDLSR